MPGADVLLTVAEIAVAFAGFASVVVLFQQGEPARWAPAVVVRLRTMIESSLVTLFAALMPFLLHHGGLADESLWGTASAVLVVAYAAFGARVWGRSRGAVASGELSGAFSAAMAGVTLLVGAALLCNAFGVLLQRGIGAYLVGVAWILGFSSLMFLRLAAFSDSRPGSG